MAAAAARALPAAAERGGEPGEWNGEALEEVEERSRQEGEQEQQGEARSPRRGAHDLTAYILSGVSDWKLEDAGFGDAGPFRDCSIGAPSPYDHHHAALIPLHRSATVFRCGVIENFEDSDYDEDNVSEGPKALRTPHFPTTLSGDVSAVGAGAQFGVALCRDGRVHSWGLDEYIGRDGDGAVPAAVRGLPPVALLAAGQQAVVTISAEDEAHGWGKIYGLEDEPVEFPPVRIAALSGRRICRIAYGHLLGAAETRLGDLLTWSTSPRRVRRVSEVALRFPLRGLVCGASSGVWVADAAGAVWFSASADWFNAADLPQRRRAVLLAAHQRGVVALTEEGDLLVTSGNHGTWQEVRSTAPELPRGLIPHGGPTSDKVVLLPDRCGGKQRLHAFARIAVRQGLPADPVRAVLARFVVNGAYLVGPEWEPFC